MTHILVKSFNRAYYLDRCLQSIQQFVEGDYQIVVLDDGTPKKYLDKIKEKFPEVEIRLSEQYDQKIQAIQENLVSGKEIDGFQIPTKLWVDAVKNASEYVVVIEDDVWFKEKTPLNELVSSMKKHQIDLVKLGWLGDGVSKVLDSEKDLTHHLKAQNLKGIFTSNPFVMDLIFYNKFKVFSVLYRLGMVDKQTKRKYWTLNSILMGLWNKEYWLYVWKDADGRVDEFQQLRNAAVWLHKNKSKENLVAFTKENFLATTFQSSATNSYHKYGHDFDVNYFNHLMNEAWLKGDFDSMQNFPKDFSLDYLDQFLDEKINQKEFHLWVERFKNQYRNIGVEID